MNTLRLLLTLVTMALPVLAEAHSLLAHTEGFSAWHIDPIALVLLLYVGWAYRRGMDRQRRRPQSTPQALKRRRGYFWAGWLTLIIALCSPLDPWGEELFSAHMVQHELLMLVAAPLLVLSRPSSALLRGSPAFLGRLFGKLAGTGGLRRGWAWVISPLAAWTIHGLVLWIWHVPGLFEASLSSTPVHILQHVSFLAVALLFWWSLFRSDHAGSGTAVIYLFTTALHASGLGALLTFSPHVWYDPYLATAPSWGLSALEDQQLGGLIMWMPAGLVYLLAGLAAVKHMLAGSDSRLRRRQKALWNSTGRQVDTHPQSPE